MKHTAFTLSLLAVGALSLLNACSKEIDAAPASSGKASKAAVESDAAREPQLAGLVGRARERWQLIENDDWIQSYSFLTKQRREMQDLGSYLSGSTVHKYVVKQDPVLVAQDGSTAYVQVLVEWTPTHPELKNAANADAGSLTSDIDMTETWVWESGDWFFMNGDRTRDFNKEHPSLFRRKSEKASDEPETAALEEGQPK
ncbi:MAG: hypothetical protein H6831_13630 [Planctomycetes bacterium]|nr:hypothetical protein [Planctomycetota bacterium]